MHILTDDQAKEVLKKRPIPNDTAGIFYDAQDQQWIWWVKIADMYDCGSESYKYKAFEMIKNYA